METVPQKRGNDSEPLQLVSFHLSCDVYGVDLRWVQEIVRLPAIARVPDAPDCIEGIANLGGRVVPVVSLRKQFGLADRKANRHTRIVVAGLDEMVAGFVVDSISEVLRLPSDALQPGAALLPHRRREYVKGTGRIGGRLLTLLDLDKVFLRNIGALWAMTYSR